MTNNPRMVLLLLFAAFLSPILIAIFLNSTWSDYRPAPSRSHGELIQPPRTLNVRLRSAAGIDSSKDTFVGRWWLIYVDRECAEPCRQRLHTLAQIQRAMGRKQAEIGIAVITPNTLSTAEARSVHGASENILQLADVYQEVEKLLAADNSGAGESYAGKTYLADPLGNIIMRYQQRQDPSGIRKDLKRLMRLTKLE